jgi:hypothetical protein
MPPPRLATLAPLLAALALLAACTSVRTPPASPASATAEPRPPINASAFGVADLDGDGAFEFIVRTPAKGIDRDGRDEIYTRWTDGDHRDPRNAARTNTRSWAPPRNS